MTSFKPVKPTGTSPGHQRRKRPGLRETEPESRENHGPHSPPDRDCEAEAEAATSRGWWDYYTMWSFVLFAVVLGSAWARLAIGSAIRALGLSWPAKAASWVPPPALVVGAIANAMLVGIGGQLLLAYGPSPSFDARCLVPARRCRRAATVHTEMHVLPMWAAAVSLAVLPALLQWEDFSLVGAAAVPAGLWAVWYLVPSSDSHRLLAKTRAVYGENLPLPCVAIGAPVILMVVVLACAWRVRFCKDAVAGAVGSCPAAAA